MARSFFSLNKLNCGLLILLLTLSLISTPVRGEESGNRQLLLATTINYPDALLTTPVTSKLGLPLLLTDREELPQATKRALTSYQPDEIFVIGGPAVISRQVTDDLRSDYQITRLWGLTRYGTSTAVANYFWPTGSEKAVMVQTTRHQPEKSKQRYRHLSAAKELAADFRAPIILTTRTNVPQSAIRTLKNLEVESVVLIGTNLTEDYRQQIIAANTSISHAYNGESSELTNDLQRQLRSNLLRGRFKRLLLVASTSFRHPLASTNWPGALSYPIFSLAEREKLVNLLTTQPNSVRQVKIIGQPALAGKIFSAVNKVGDLSVDLVLNRAVSPSQVAATLLEENEQLMQQTPLEREDWQQTVEEGYYHQIKDNRSAWKQAIAREME